jgi:hypothetical protein
MLTMKSLFALITAISIGSISPAFAQLKGFSFGPYIESAWPKGDLANTNGKGIGAGISADIKVFGKISAMGSLGIIHFGRYGSGETTQPLNASPLRLGVKYRLPFIYLKMESGVVKFKNGEGSAPIISPGIGFRLLGLDIQGSYEAWLRSQGTSFSSLKIAYHF